MKEYIVHAPDDHRLAVEEYTSFYGEPMTELIRCKDCKCWTKPYGWNGFCEHGIPAEADDYCSWAERKERKEK